VACELHRAANMDRVKETSVFVCVGLRRSALVLVAGACAITLAAAPGCSASGGTGEGGGYANGGSGSGNPGSGSGGFAAVGSGAGPGSGGSSINADAGGGSGGLLQDGEACASESHRAEQSPLDLYLMVDKSGSMVLEDFGIKWPAVINAIKGFVNQSPQVDGLGVGLAFFPTIDPALDACITQCGGTCACVQQCGCTSGCNCSGTCTCPGGNQSCSVADYQRPTVPIGMLPQAAAGIAAALDQQMPLGGTPTLPALQGALEHAKFWASSNPGHKVAVVLATDGKPTECQSTVQNVAQAAAAALNGTPRIMTFVIGVGNALFELNEVAAAGGTGQAFIVNTGGNAQQQFIDALNKIRGMSLSCEFLLPQPANGATLDFTKVNVQFTPPNGAPTIVKQVKSQAECDPVEGGWFYDNPQNPTRILACPKSCDAFNVQFGAQVDVLLGCQTITATPR
jgi:hypothetical protein